MARRTVTEELFTSCKSLQEQGSSVYSAAQALKISDVTVRRIYKSDTIAEYKKRLKDWNPAGDKPAAQLEKQEQVPDRTPEHAADNPEELKIRVSFELGETARRAIDGLLALVGVKLQ
jgi:hypothetical protein